jgi:hypothetical protein
MPDLEISGSLVFRGRDARATKGRPPLWCGRPACKEPIQKADRPGQSLNFASGSAFSSIARWRLSGNVTSNFGRNGLERMCRSRRCWEHPRSSFSRTSGPNNAREGHSRRARWEIQSQQRASCSSAVHSPQTLEVNPFLFLRSCAKLLQIFSEMAGFDWNYLECLRGQQGATGSIEGR